MTMSTATQQYVKWRLEDRVAIVTIDHAPVNALNTATMNELSAVIDEVAADDRVKAVIITGNGMAFVAGADINEIAAIQNADEAVRLVKGGQAVFDKIESLTKPVIAAINGVALGGGLELAMACHVRVASDRAKMGQPEINLGIIPGFGGTQRLPRLVGWAKATELLLTADNITAQEAFRIGLVNKVVPESDVLKQSLGLAKKITGFGAQAISAIMEALAYGRSHDLADSLDREAQLFGRVAETQDKKEGVAAFKEKRRPNFSDR
jgi:enoyl-CoA hydratase/carnithine racemase